MIATLHFISFLCLLAMILSLHFRVNRLAREIANRRP